MTSTMNIISEAKRDGKHLSTVKNEISAIVEATKVYKTVRNDMYHLYDLYNPDNKPDEDLSFNIGVYSEKDIETLREAQQMQQEMSAITDDDEEDDVEDDEEDTDTEDF